MIVIRECEGHDELEACVQLQVETWGYDQTDVIPRKAFLVMQKIGGQVLGAFDTSLPGTSPHGEPNSLVGFAMSLPGVKPQDKNGAPPRPYLHSHMLAVREAYRNHGLGAQLKLEQRREALARGIRLMEWTFDPLEIKNAHLNIARLGAISRRYKADFYGPSSSPLQGGLPTDRLYAEWWLKSPRVTGALRGEVQPMEVIERVTVPQTIYQWKQDPEQRGKAEQLQLKNRKALQSGFDRGLAVVGYERDAEGNGSFLLGPWNDAEQGAWSSITNK